MSLVHPLLSDRIDIIGDVHGEIDALNSLIEKLGYNLRGEHPDGRRLVFLGDLTDRGPDSPAVVERVRELVEAGKAQCVLGNHDLNLMLNRRKFDNDWFFGDPFTHEGQVVPQRLADEPMRKSIVDFFKTLPLALEGYGCRIVHACWNDHMIDVARGSTETLALMKQGAEHAAATIKRLGITERTERKLIEQNENPVKVLTSGLEQRGRPSETESNSHRLEERVQWWRWYFGPELCVFGHYGHSQRSGRGYCVDYGAGYRYQERFEPQFSGHHQKYRLAAYRYPDGTMLFEDGTSPEMSAMR